MKHTALAFILLTGCSAFHGQASKADRDYCRRVEASIQLKNPPYRSPSYIGPETHINKKGALAYLALKSTIFKERPEPKKPGSTFWIKDPEKFYAYDNCLRGLGYKESN